VNLQVSQTRASQIAGRVQAEIPAASFDEQLRRVIELARECAA
jgi:hypothetical protein